VRADLGVMNQGVISCFLQNDIIYNIRRTLFMRKLSIVFIFLFTTILISSAIGGGSYPDWVLPTLKNYPTDSYLFGVGMSKGTGQVAFKEATARANNKVTTEILERVASTLRNNRNKLEYDMVLEHYSAVMEDYCRGRYAFPALKIEGLKVRNLSVDNAREEHETYALVYIDRIELKKIYETHVSRLYQEIERRLKIARDAEDKLDNKAAINAYLRTYPLYESLKASEIILIGAEYPPKPNIAFKKLVNSATNIHDDPLPHRNVIKRVEKLENNLIVNIYDIVKALDSQITRSGQLQMPDVKVLLLPLIYKESEMVSPFALELTKALQKEFRWTVVDLAREFKQTPINVKKLNDDYPYRLNSSIWHNGDEITIRATIRNVNTGEFHGSAVVRFLESQLRDRFTYIPRGYDDAQKEKEAFNPRYFVIEQPRGNDELQEHQFAPIGGLKVDIWTGRGRGPLTYIDGDKVTVYARVNQPAYLRLLNTHADQKRVLLVDNLYIGQKNVNKDVVVGTFWCHAPYGVEFLNVAARTEEFPDIETFKEDDYHFLVQQDPEKAAAEFRGLKPFPKNDKKDQQFIGPNPIIDKQPSFQQVEAQLVITTEEK